MADAKFVYEHKFYYVIYQHRNKKVENGQSLPKDDKLDIRTKKIKR